MDKSETEEEGRTGTCVTRIIGNTPIIKDLQLNLVSLGKEAVLVQEFYIQLTHSQGQAWLAVFWRIR